MKVDMLVGKFLWKVVREAGVRDAGVWSGQ